MKKRLLALLMTIMFIVVSVSLDATIVNATKVTKKGYYWTIHGEYSMYGNSETAVAKKYTFKGKKLTIYGSLKRGKKMDVNGKYLSDNKRTFIVSKKCKFYLNDGQGERVKFKRKKFKKCMKESFGRGGNYVYDFRLRVKKGKVVCMELIQA